MALPKDLNGLSPEERQRVKVVMRALDEGRSKRSLTHQLTGGGMDAEAAAAFVDTADAFRRANHYHMGKVSVAFGGVLTVMGLIPILVFGSAAVVGSIVLFVWAGWQFFWGWNAMEKRIATSEAQRAEDGV